MPPKENDIFKDVYIGWTTREGEVIGKVKYSELSTDGFSCEIELTDVKKEEKMKYDMKNVTSISIEKSDDDGTVTATAYGRDPYCPGHVAVIKRASAKCGPNDIYDFNIGAKLALDRLYEGYDMTPKPKRKPYNGKIFVHHYPGIGLLNDCLYRVKDGVIQNCWFHNPDGAPYIFKDMTNDELCRTIQIEMYGSDAPSANVIAYFVRHDESIER